MTSTFLTKYVAISSAFDDDDVRSQGFQTQNCRRTSFHRMHNPFCNDIHGLDLAYEWNQFSGNGFYRLAFRYWEDDESSVIMKTIDFSRHDFDVWNYEFQR